MKYFFLFLLIITLTANSVFAYTIKIYDNKGKHIGYAHKIGEDFEITDIEGKKVTDYDTFYASIDSPENSTIHTPKIKNSNPGLKWYGAGRGTNLKNIKTDTGKRIKVVRFNPYTVNSVNIKVYDRGGKFIGYAKTDGTTDYIIYDKNNNIINPEIPLYSPPGTPLRSYFERYRDNPPY